MADSQEGSTVTNKNDEDHDDDDDDDDEPVAPADAPPPELEQQRRRHKKRSSAKHRKSGGTSSSSSGSVASSDQSALSASGDAPSTSLEQQQPLPPPDESTAVVDDKEAITRPRYEGPTSQPYRVDTTTCTTLPSASSSSSSTSTSTASRSTSLPSTSPGVPSPSSSSSPRPPLDSPPRSSSPSPRPPLDSPTLVSSKPMSSPPPLPRSQSDSTAAVVSIIISDSDSTPIAPATSSASAPVISATRSLDGFLSGMPNNVRDRSESRFAGQPMTRQEKRLAVIDELVTTEAAYINDLRIIIELIMVPLREKREFMSGERLVSDEQMAQIFGDIENFPAINKALLARLQEEHSKPDDERLIGQVFLKTFDFFIVYTQYLCKHTECLAHVEKLCKESQFEAFLLERRDVEEECRNLDLKAFLVKPVQRLCKYPLLLRELLRYTDVSHKDYPDLVRASSKVEGVVASINAKAKKSEQQALMLRAAEEMDIPEDSGFKLVTPARIFIAQVECSKLVHSVHHWKEGMVYLFNDVVVFTKQSKAPRTPTFRRRGNRPKKTVRNSYKYKYHWPISKCQASAVDSGSSKQTDIVAIVMHNSEGPAETTMVSISNDDQRTAFIRALQAASAPPS